jgi:hypothetical protein
LESITIIFLKIYLKNIILYALSILLGGLFIISAYFKIIEIELFELNLVDTGLVGWNFAKWMALLIISSELFSGLLIITTIYIIALLGIVVNLYLLSARFIVDQGEPGKLQLFWITYYDESNRINPQEYFPSGYFIYSL